MGYVGESSSLFLRQLCQMNSQQYQSLDFLLTAPLTLELNAYQPL